MGGRFVAGSAAAGVLLLGVGVGVAVRPAGVAARPAGASEGIVIGTTGTSAAGRSAGMPGVGIEACSLVAPRESGASPVSAPRGLSPRTPREAAQGMTAARRGEVNGTPASGARRVVRILAERFSFTPSEIRVPRGVTLELRVRSDDTMHGFRIAARNVNLMVPKRRQGEAVVVFEATEPGRYEFECSRLCGAGHNFMRGAIVVEETPAAGRGARP